MGLACAPQGAAAASPKQGLSYVPLKHFSPLKPQVLPRFSQQPHSRGSSDKQGILQDSRKPAGRAVTSRVQVGPCGARGPEQMAVEPLPAQGAPSPLSHWMCTSTADFTPAPQVPVHKPSHTNQVQDAFVWAPVTAQHRGLLVPLTYLPVLEVFALAPVSLKRKVPPCRYVDVLLLRHSVQTLLPLQWGFWACRGFLCLPVPLPRVWNQLRSSPPSFFATFLHPPCSSFLHRSRHSQEVLLTLATSLAIFSRRSRGEKRKVYKNWRVRKVGLKEE